MSYLKADLIEVIRDLMRCAAQNEKDAKQSAGWCHLDCAQAGAVAAEQRRMIKVLRALVNKFDKGE